jgi:hypothetical protein
MTKLLGWIACVPWWAWLFLVATQALNLAVISGRVRATEGTLLHLADLEERVDDPEFLRGLEDQRRTFEDWKREQWFQIIGSAILLPAFVAGAVWRWWAVRAKSEANEPASTRS